jgi:hypothetical protein
VHVSATSHTPFAERQTVVVGGTRPPDSRDDPATSGGVATSADGRQTHVARTNRRAKNGDAGAVSVMSQAADGRQTVKMFERTS